MSRPALATLAGLAFVLCYVVGVVALAVVMGRLHWAVEAIYWGAAGIVWVVPVRWLMLWSVGKR